jgi:tetratricopeptide (TPR) repeat protein
MRRPAKPLEPVPIIIVQQIQKSEWIMKMPRVTEEVDDRLEEGIDWIDGDPKRAISIFLELVEQYPEHMDAYHHLALTLDRMGKKEEAFQTWKSAVDTALKFFPEHFSMEHDRLEWGFIENRPFLRLYHSYGLQLWDHGETRDALEVFENLLGLSPNDNQGARALAVGCYLELEEPSGVLSICRQFKNDAMEHLVYGKTLALFQLGKLKQAEKALRIAINCYPLIAAELLKTKHRKPKSIYPNRVTLGGPDQAYVYWQDDGKYWAETPGAIDFLRKHKSPGSPNDEGQLPRRNT